MPDPTTCLHRDVITEADLGELPIPLRITADVGDDMKDLAALVSIGRCPRCDQRVASVVLQLHWSPIPMFVTLPAVVERGPGAYRADAAGWSL